MTTLLLSSRRGNKSILVHWRRRLSCWKMYWRIQKSLLGLGVVGHCWFEVLSLCFTNIISIDLVITIFCLGSVLISRNGMSIMRDGMQKLLTGCCDGRYSRTLHPTALDVSVFEGTNLGENASRTWLSNLDSSHCKHLPGLSKWVIIDHIKRYENNIRKDLQPPA